MVLTVILVAVVLLGPKTEAKCHAKRPPLPTWAMQQDNLLTWSAEGGSKVEIRFGFFEDDMPFHFITSNDGHEKVGLGTTAGYWGKFWQIRTINECKAGEWSPIYQ